MKEGLKVCVCLCLISLGSSRRSATLLVDAALPCSEHCDVSFWSLYRECDSVSVLMHSSLSGNTLMRAICVTLFQLAFKNVAEPQVWFQTSPLSTDFSPPSFALWRSCYYETGMFKYVSYEHFTSWKVHTCELGSHNYDVRCIQITLVGARWQCTISA